MAIITIIQYGPLLIFYLTIFPVANILAFQPSGLGSCSMRATARYLYEGLVAAVYFCVRHKNYQDLNNV